METIVLLLLVATGTVGAVGSGNDEGRNEVTESSLLTPSTGSSDMATTTEPLHLGNCVVPLYSDRTSIKVTSPVVAAIAESAENRVRLSIEGRCFLACAASDTVNQVSRILNYALTINLAVASHKINLEYIVLLAVSLETSRSSATECGALIVICFIYRMMKVRNYTVYIQDKVEINNDLTEYWPYVTVKTCGISWKVSLLKLNHRVYGTLTHVLRCYICLGS